MSGTGKTLIRGSVARLLSTALTAAMGLIFLPYIVEALGDRLYGAWALVGTVTGYYGLLDLGLSLAVARFVSRALGQGDRDEANAVVTTSFYCFVGAGLVCLVATAVIAIAVAMGWFVDDPKEAALFWRVLLVMGCGLALTFPARSFLGVLNAHIRYDLIGVQDIVATITRFGLILVSLKLEGGLLGLSLAAVAGMIPRLVLSAMFAWRVHGAFPLNPRVVTKERIKTLFSYGFITFLSQIADLLRRNIYPVLIPPFLGLAAVTPIKIAQQVSNLLVLGGTSFLANLMPVFSSQEGRGDTEGIRKVYLFVYKISCYVGVFGGGMTLVMGDAFVARWVPQHRELVVPLMYYLVGVAALGIIQIPTVNLLYGVSKHKSFLFANMIDGVLVVGLSVLLITDYGLMGVVVGTLIACAIARLIVMPISAGQILKMPLFEYYAKHTLPNLLKPGLFVVAAYFAAQSVLSPDYLRLTIVGAASCVAFGAYIFVVGFNGKERSLLLSAIRRRKLPTDSPEQKA